MGLVRIGHVQSYSELKPRVVGEPLGVWGLLWGLTKWDRRADGAKGRFV